MKKIVLNKGSLELPETWDELTFKQKIYAFARLKDMVELKISPPMFRILMLKYLTNYRPSSGVFRLISAWILYLLKMPFMFFYYICRLGFVRLSGYWSVWKEYNRPSLREREIINYNLYRLSEQLDFAFSMEGNTVRFKRKFAKNPFPYLKIGGQKFTGKKFIQDIAPFTNITAKEYCDCCELYSGYHSFEDPEEKESCINKMISILYPASADYNVNLVSDHAEVISTLAPEIKFGIMYWFAGIIEFYTTHPVYSILFDKGLKVDSPDEMDKISLGMNETLLMAKRKGYASIGSDTVNDFFDTQIKIIKDDLSAAIAKGAKIEDLSKETGMRIEIINKLT